ncbi:MAG: GT2 family glycosyltransferase [Myxococcota bacterium]
MIDLSIIILNFNTKSLLLDCIESALSGVEASSRKLEHEVFVVDNGSSDGSAAAVRSAYPAVTTIALERNVGFAGGNNVAIERARGRIVLLLNTDVILAPDAIEQGVAALEASPNAGAAGVQLVHPDGRLQNSIHSYPGVLQELVPSWLLEVVAPKRFPSKRRPPSETTEVEAVLGAVLFFKREIVDRIGLLPDAYFFFLEETHWCWQMRKAGYSVLHVPAARATHLSGASSKKVDPVATRIEYHRSLYYFVRSNRGALCAVSVRSLRFIKALVVVVPLALLGSVSAKHKSRFHSARRLLAWHLAGCPASWGLSGSRGAV